MLSPRKAALLQSLLGSLPAQAAARLAKAVEIDRLAGGLVLPHDLILGTLRPMLRTPPVVERTPTPLRLFCRPFEDLVVAAAPKDKQKGRIARASIAPVWAWLNQTLLTEASLAYAAEVKALVFAARLDDALESAAQFWVAAGKAMADAIARNRKAVRGVLMRRSDRRRRGGDGAAAPGGREIREIQTLLPKPSPQLDDATLRRLRDVNDRVAATVPDAAAYVAVVAMNRLVRPWEALKLPQIVAHQTHDTLISATDMGLVGDLLFADIELHGGALRAARHPLFDADAMVDHLASFAVLSSSIVKEIDIRRDRQMGQAPAQGPRRGRRSDGRLHGAGAEGDRGHAAGAEDGRLRRRPQMRRLLQGGRRREGRARPALCPPRRGLRALRRLGLVRRRAEGRP